jgi:hypothetical protein
VRRIRTVVAALALLTACTGGPAEPGPSTPVAALPNGDELPSGCSESSPTPAQTVTFVADGRAWATEPVKDATPACLFEVADPGRFEWGPLADRVLLANLEVRGVLGGPDRPAGDVDPAMTSWGRPTGKSLVFIPDDGSAVLKAHPESASVDDVTPMHNTKFLDVTYHPSGLAFAYVVQRTGGQAIWMSSNTGTDPKRLVFSDSGTRFGPVTFANNGSTFFYAAVHEPETPAVHRLDLPDLGVSTVWTGEKGRVTDLWPGSRPNDLAFTVGEGCAKAEAMVINQARGRVESLVPNETRPTRALGWLDPRTLLVSIGPCDAPLDLKAVNALSGEAVPLVTGVTAGSIRVAVATPPPPLPGEIVQGSGVA